MPRPAAPRSDPPFLQVKEAEALVLSWFAGASKYANQGQRAGAGQRLMQASSDIFPGWQRTEAGTDGEQRDSYVRQLGDWKFFMSIEITEPQHSDLRQAVPLDAGPSARPLRGPDRRHRLPRRSDVFDQAITVFAAACADQNGRDH